jgi:DNA-binding winged helix-turn-helix (wHTH) protein/TolB-like protein
MHSPALSRLRLNGRVADFQRGSVTDASGRTTTLRPQAAEVLSVLATKAGQVVTKDELMEAVWGDIAVTDDSLVQCIAEIRKALADEKHETIRTLPKRGYVLETETTQDPEKAAAIRSALLRAKSWVLGHARYNVAPRFERRDKVHLKNIAVPVKVYSVSLEQTPAGKSTNRWASSKWPVLAALLLLVAAGVGYLAVETSQQPILPAASMAGSAPVQTSRSLPPQQTVASAAPVPADTGSASGDGGIPVIAVLPFQDLTGDNSPSDLGKGIAEAFKTDLATFPDFEVVSSTSSFAYAGKPIPEIVKGTGALFVIEGSLRRTGDRAAVTVQLIRGDTDRHLKIAHVEEQLSDPVQFQAKVADRLRDELGGMTGILRQQYNRIAQSKPDVDRNEYDYYALGHVESLHGRVEEAGKIWQEGLERFPKSALLHYKLMIYYLDVHNAVEPAAKLWADAEKLPRRSRLDDWYRHWLSAWLHGWRDEHGPAVSEARAAIAMAPYDAVSHSGLSWVMREAGETDEAIEWAKFAVTHDPNMYNRSYFRALKDAYKAARKWPEAVALGEAQVSNDPVHAKWWYEFLDAAYSATDQPEKAHAAWKSGLNLPEPPEP